MRCCCCCLFGDVVGCCWLRVVSLIVDGVVVLTRSLLADVCALSFLRRSCRLYVVAVCCLLFVVGVICWRY